MTTGADATIFAPRLFDGEGWHSDALVEVSDGIILSIDPATRTTRRSVLRLPSDTVLAPGLVDLQVNGGGGALLNDDVSLATIRTMATAHQRCGTTAILPTLITDAPHKTKTLIALAAEALTIPGIAGFHLEGPFISSTRKGAHDAVLIRQPTADDMADLAALASLGPTLVTLAPERVSDQHLQALVAAGIVIAAGHSDATADQLAHAASLGLSGVTHLFNAMSQITSRAPGVVGGALDHAALFAGIIADGHHVADANVRMAQRLLGRDRLFLVSDAMPTAGSALTTFTLQGRRITLTDGRLTDAAGTLAGAHLTMIEAVRHLLRIGVDLESALIMATRTPARFLRAKGRDGLLAPGARADMVALRGEGLAVHEVWVDGVATLAHVEQE
jgi:N-acetylglucosamine-6-phosphate deacetylase